MLPVLQSVNELSHLHLKRDKAVVSLARQCLYCLAGVVEANSNLIHLVLLTCVPGEQGHPSNMSKRVGRWEMRSEIPAGSLVSRPPRVKGGCVYVTEPDVRTLNVMAPAVLWVS